MSERVNSAILFGGGLVIGFCVGFIDVGPVAGLALAAVGAFLWALAWIGMTKT